MTDNTTTTTVAAPTVQHHHHHQRRYIYNDDDLQQFIHSPTFDSFYKFTIAMGKACSSSSSSSSSSTSTVTDDATTTTTSTRIQEYDPKQPYIGCSPGIACLHGILSVLKDWMYEPDLHPSSSTTIGTQEQHHLQYRFGHPLFRTWHSLLSNCSKELITCILQTSNQYAKMGDDTNDNSDCCSDYDIDILHQCYEAGRNITITTAAAVRKQQQGQEESVSLVLYDSLSVDDQTIVTELATYLMDAFGHPIRLDYGTGHETCFQIFLYLLCQHPCNIFTNIGYTFTSKNDINDVKVKEEEDIESIKQQKKQQPNSYQQPSLLRCKAIMISIYHSYLAVTRTIQTIYNLEPAGSHGVWGLDDYYCLAFYYGACQLASVQQHNEDLQQRLVPSSIHDNQIVEQYCDTYLYYSCIKFITTMKRNVPFYESSPMLNDISYIATWYKIASGLIKLYHGEVLCKRPVVQHIQFGTVLFTASWIPSQLHDTILPPTETFRATTSSTSTTSATVPTRPSTNNSDMPSMTRAPWAK